MDVTPQLLREVEFREKFRGYDPDQVDELLERAGQQIAQLQGRLREALERAETAESRATGGGGGGYSETEETLRRTLVLAQRTADAVVAEAKEIAATTRTEADDYARRTIADADEQSTTTLAEARLESKRLVADAADQADAIRSEAAAEARRVIEASREPLREEIRELEQVRDQLRDDIGILERHLDEQRERLVTTVAALHATISDPATLRLSPAPATSTASLPPARDHGLEDHGLDDHGLHDKGLDDVVPPPRAASAPEPEATQAFTPVLADELGEGRGAEVDLREPEPDDDRPFDGAAEDAYGADDLDDDDAEPWGDDDWADPAFEPAPAPRSARTLPPEDFDEPTVSPSDIEEPPAPRARGARRGQDGGDLTEELFRDREPSRQRDPFLDQLRQAVDDADDDDTSRAMEAFFEPDDDRRSRFGRRR